MQQRRTPKGSRTPQPYAARIARLRAELERRSLDGYLVLDRLDQIWLTGFTGEDGGVLVTPRAVVLLTDGRFAEAADREAPYARKVLRKQRTPETNVRALRRYRIKRLGFDPAQMNVADYARYRKLARPTQLVSVSGLISGMRASKDAGEVAAIRRAVRVAEQAFQALRRWLRPGVSERQVAAYLDYQMARRGAQGSSFPTIVAAGANASLPHYEPGQRRIRAGEAVLVDWGARVGWYCSDLTRMIWAGKLPRRLASVYEIVREAHDRALRALRPGLTAHAVDRVARECITRAGYGRRFDHALGHGLGLNVHEAPRVGKGTKDVLRAGMVVTIEPGIYLPGVGGIRLEDDVLVTATGSEVLTSLPL